MKLGLLSDLHWSVAPGASGRADAGFHAPYDFERLAARCAATVEALVAHGCELIVVAGDLTHDGDEAACEAALACLIDASPIPVAVVEGNHDVLLDRTAVPRRTAVRDGWRRAMAVADEQLVALRGVGVDRDGRWTREREGGGFPPAVPAHCLSTVVVSHFPLVSHVERLAAACLPCPGELAERDALLRLLAATRLPTIVLSGHLHVRDATAHRNVLQICVSALVERPHEAAVVELDPFGEVVHCTRIGSGTAAAASGAEPWLLAPVEERWDFAAGSWTRRELVTASERTLVEAVR